MVAWVHDRWTPERTAALEVCVKGQDELDELDFEILRLLQRNARMPNKRLAERVGIAPSTCLERVRRLVSAGVILGFRADVEARALGIGLQAMIAVRLRQHSRDLVESFREYALTLDEVLAVYHVAGANDFLVHLAARDANHLRDLALDAFTTRPEVAHLETYLIFDHSTSTELPRLSETSS
jgi:DNA-binding Lrp family transcriptional regulator